uniref:TEF transcription factor, PAR bZIP family member a n=1 Tax=Oryzias sinensis TaxID=183150 RepID=A0A8C7WM30_9TELE
FKPPVLLLEPGAEGTGVFPVVLKKIMEMPPPNILEGDDGENTDKEKLGLGENADLSVGGSDMGPSAALTPAIWDKTIPYDGETFHLEYMDLEEFLMENGIPTSPGEEAEEGNVAEKAKVTASQSKVAKPAKVSPVSLRPVQELDKCDSEVVTTSKDRVTPDPIDPDEIEIDVNYDPDPTDLVLSSHRFSEEELKPQPMIKKAKKVFVPEEQKDEKYWQRRKKNNVAAKRSRDARRLKENQITVRAAFLERENAALRSEVAELRKECGRYKNVVGHYEAKFGTL